VRITVHDYLCTTIVHNTPQNSSDNFPAYPSPDNHRCSYVVLWSGAEHWWTNVTYRSVRVR